MRPNQAQKEAICHRTGPCMVLAGPGSGKTFTIARRIEYLIDKCKVRPEEILVITFTRYAASEMRQRFQNLAKGKCQAVTFGTFHSIYYGVLKWAYRFTSANILSEEEKCRLIRQIVNLPQFDLDQCAQAGDEQDYVKDLSVEIGRVKNSRLDIGAYQSKEHGEMFQDVYRLYETQRKQMRKVDFDDMLTLCYDLFKERPDILQKWQQRYRYILVDEFQDVNKVQYDVLRMLAMPSNNLFVVGDDDQSIYSFRGASSEIMLNFPKDYPGAKKILLDVNYRSTKNIAEGAARVISHNKARYQKEIVSAGETGPEIHVQELKDVLEESHYIVSQLELLKKQNVLLEEISVLYRTGQDARALAETLMEYQIPFVMKENFSSIYDHFVARNLKSYLRLASGERSRRLFLDIMNCPKRYISRESLESPEMDFEMLRSFYRDKVWMQERIDQFEWDIKMMEGQTPYAAIRYIRERIGYDGYLREYAKMRKINEDDLFALLDEIEQRSKTYVSVAEWLSYTETYAEKMREQRKEKPEQKRGVSLMTMHGAKGLEFDTVFIIGANEGTTPYKKAKLTPEIEEERRMFYVAMTRAKHRLFICYVKSKNGKELGPSRFIEELLTAV